MIRSELIEQVVAETGLNKSVVAAAVEAIVSGIGVAPLKPAEVRSAKDLMVTVAASRQVTKSEADSVITGLHSILEANGKAGITVQPAGVQMVAVNADEIQFERVDRPGYVGETEKNVEK